MSEVFSIQLSNHTTQPDGKTGVWLDLPATAEQVQAAMGQIGVTQDNPWDYFISGFSSPEGRRLAIPHDMALASGVNELNFLAARLEKLNDYEIGTLNAALQQKNTEMRTIWRMIDYADNLDYYVNLPDIHNRPDRRTREVQAESVAYAVCQHYGLDTSDYSFGYVAGWSSGKELSELKASLETIRATANDLITKIDGHLAQLQQEREAQQEQAPPIWNGLDGLINDKPFMPGATPEQQANALIDFAERDGQRLGNEERRLIVDYANVIRDYHKVP